MLNPASAELALPAPDGVAETPRRPGLWAALGEDVTLYHGVTLGGTSWRQGKRHPTLGDQVVVGAGAKILGPVTLGDRVRVGANSVVIRGVPEGCTVVGIPAKVVRNPGSADLNPHGIDLNHHLIPDPVAAAIQCLLNRIRHLEQALDMEGCGSAGTDLEPACAPCAAQAVCAPSESSNP